MKNNTGNDYVYIGEKLRISSANIYGTGLMLGERVKYTANNGYAVISTANTNLDGSGAITDLITGGTCGTVVKRIIIKAYGSTTEGMIRIFHKDGSGTTRLLREIPVPAVTRSSLDPTLIAVIDDYFYLKTTLKLRVSTEKAETFVITAEGLDMTYPS